MRRRPGRTSKGAAPPCRGWGFPGRAGVPSTRPRCPKVSALPPPGAAPPIRRSRTSAGGGEAGVRTALGAGAHARGAQKRPLQNRRRVAGRWSISGVGEVDGGRGHGWPTSGAIDHPRGWARRLRRHQLVGVLMVRASDRTCWLAASGLTPPTPRRTCHDTPPRTSDNGKKPDVGTNSVPLHRAHWDDHLQAAAAADNQKPPLQCDSATFNRFLRPDGRDSRGGDWCVH